MREWQRKTMYAIGCVFLAGGTTHGSNLEALQTLGWLMRMNEVDEGIRASRDVGSAAQEMERLHKIAKAEKTPENVERYNQAKDAYQTRYTQRLQQGPYADVIQQMGANDYFSLANAYQVMDKRAQGFGYPSAQTMSLEAQKDRVQELDAKMCQADIGQSIGEAVSVFKGVEVKRPGGGTWIPLYEGRPLFLQDTVRTGPQGRLRIQLRDRVESGNKGPTVVNVGSQSEVRMEKFEVFEDGSERKGLIDLIRGFLRAKTNNWGARSVFSVRTGTSLCGIRGTEVEVLYDEENRIATYRLHSGEASVTHPAGTTPLKAGEEVIIRNGTAEQPRAFRPL